MSSRTIMYAKAIILDALDVLHFIPIIGWAIGAVIDIIAFFIMIPEIGSYAFIGMAEFAPVIGAIPFWTSAVILYDMQQGAGKNIGGIQTALTPKIQQAKEEEK